MTDVFETVIVSMSDFESFVVRFMKFPDALPDGGTLDGLRITIGTDAEIDRVLEVMGGVTSSL